VIAVNATGTETPREGARSQDRLVWPTRETPQGPSPARVLTFVRRSLLPLAAALIAAVLPAPAGAAGITTHAFMAERATDHVGDPALQRLLRVGREAVLSGAAFPDGGYAVSSMPGGDYGEVSHWERFVNAYAAHLRADPGCRPIESPDGPCASKVAHLMGVAAHGMGDEMWDWMFEPHMADHHESPVHPVYRSGLPGAAEMADLPPGSLANTSEYAMDLIALVDHWRWPNIGLYAPPFDDLLAVYGSIGRGDVRREGLAAGHAALHAAMAGERAAIAADYARVKTTMPWTSAHMHDAPGGVEDTARSIAGYYEMLWRKLTGAGHPPPRVAGVQPEDGEQGVTTEFSPALTGPGPNGGGAEQRIVAVLASAVDPATVTPSNFRLYGENGFQVKPLAGFPRPGPYGAGDGTHSLMFHPARDLTPCRRYTAVLTRGIRDLAGARLPEQFAWSFVTRPAAGARDCPPR
jgi:hypothetical protein